MDDGPGPMCDEGLVPPPVDGWDGPPDVDGPPDAEPWDWSRHVPDGWLADMMTVEAPRARDEDALRTMGCYDTLERTGGWERVIGWAQANQVRQVAAFVARALSRFARPADRPKGMWDKQLMDAVVAEVGLMLRASARTAHSRVADAVALVGSLPATLAALEAGTISLPSARAMVEETRNLGREQAADVENAVLGKAGEQTPGQVRAAVRRAVTEVDPEAVRKRHRQAKRERGVWLYDDPDGMATLLARLPAPEAVGAYAVVDECARHAGGPHDDRTLDARRADALVDLLLDTTGSAETADQPPEPVPDLTESRASTGAAGPFVSAGSARAYEREPVAGRVRRTSRVRVQVRVTVPYTTLLGLDEQAGELAGYGPIPPEVARELAAEGTWRRIVTDPLSGALLDVGTTRYRPPPNLAEHVIARSQTCEFPGCRVRADRCDLDHRVPYDPDTGTGPTAEHNIGPDCRTHHQVKQMPGWSVSRDPDGTIRWRTPTGHEYTTVPPPAAAPSITRPPPDPGDDDPPF